MIIKLSATNGNPEPRKKKMMNDYQRLQLSRQKPPEGCIGYDCDGKVIKENDLVEVLKEDDIRKNMPRYDFCSVGCRGRATKNFSFPEGWFTSVIFEGDDKVGCLDYHLRLVAE